MEQNQQLTNNVVVPEFLIYHLDAETPTGLLCIYK